MQTPPFDGRRPLKTSQERVRILKVLGEHGRVSANDRIKPLVVTDISEIIEVMKKLFGMTNFCQVLLLKLFLQVSAF